LLAGLALISVLLVGNRLQVFADRAANDPTFHRHARELANWMREHTPPGARFATQDAGIVGWFSDRPVMNLDGVASSWGYQQALAAGDFGAWLLTPVAHGGAGAHFLIEHYFGPDSSAIPTRRGPMTYHYDRVRYPGLAADENRLPLPHTVIVYQGVPFGTASEPHQFVVWDLRGGPGGD
jgi:hypothetical protein